MEEEYVLAFVRADKECPEGTRREIYFYLPHDFLKKFDGITGDRPSIFGEYLGSSWGTSANTWLGEKPLRYIKIEADTTERERELILDFKEEVRDALKNLRQRKIRKTFCEGLVISLSDCE